MCRVREVARVQLPNLPSHVLDADIDDSGHYVALIGDDVRGHFDHWANGLVIDRINLQVLFDSGEMVPLQKSCRAPIVRVMGRSALLVNRIAEKHRSEFAWIVDRQSQVLPSFTLGDS